MTHVWCCQNHFLKFLVGILVENYEMGSLLLVLLNKIYGICFTFEMKEIKLSNRHDLLLLYVYRYFSDSMKNWMFWALKFSPQLYIAHDGTLHAERFLNIESIKKFFVHKIFEIRCKLTFLLSQNTKIDFRETRLVHTLIKLSSPSSIQSMFAFFTLQSFPKLPLLLSIIAAIFSLTILFSLSSYIK